MGLHLMVTCFPTMMDNEQLQLGSENGVASFPAVASKMYG